jgi:very-short-patch-repair endonuclease
VIEADGGAFHDNPLARANLDAKQARLEARGLRVERLRWRQVTSVQNATAAELRHVIAEMEESRR